MKLAVVFDDLVQFGGAERLLLAVHEIWPDAPVYVSGASAAWKKRCADLGIDLRVSFADKFPFFAKLTRLYGLLFVHVLGFLSFDLRDYDVVLSISARYAHLVVTQPTTKHICYMNSPGRMYWEPHTYFSSKTALLITPFLSLFRLCDFAFSKYVDYFIANSQTPQQRIKKYYGRESTVIYPFTDDLHILGPIRPATSQPYFLTLSRLVAWKRIDIAIEACGELGLPLKVASTGPELAHYKKLAQKYPSVEILGYVSETEKVNLLANCSALINTQLEDFGIAPVEAMALGKPVIAYGKGGVTETVVQNKTGVFFFEQNVKSLKTALLAFTATNFAAQDCQDQAANFTKVRFIKQLRDFVNSVYLKN